MRYLSISCQKRSSHKHACQWLCYVLWSPMKISYIDKQVTFIKEEDSLASSAAGMITSSTIPDHKTLPISILKLINVSQEFNQDLRSYSNKPILRDLWATTLGIQHHVLLKKHSTSKPLMTPAMNLCLLCGFQSLNPMMQTAVYTDQV